MRTPIVAANWKMNPPPAGWDASDSPFRPREGVDAIVFPSAIDLVACVKALKNVGAQCGRPEVSGAFTGDLSMTMIAAAGCTHVLCGHSERRTHHTENDSFVAAQMKAAIDAGLTPIVCVGETADERETGEHENTVRRQIEALGDIPSIIAYEPVWAIGTGKTATPDDAQAMHAFIRDLLPADKKETTRILYGGSVKPENAQELIAKPDIDGFLVGGASLKPDSFAGIVDRCGKKM